MTDNPMFNKIIARGDNGDLDIGGMKGKVEYTSDWQPVDGGKGVTCRTWRIKDADADVDGADIKIDKGGYTPIQLVNAANVVVDAPEFGKGYCVMTKDEKIHTSYFDGSTKKQMVWEKGMVIAWVAAESMGLTEFESPAFSDAMFSNIPDEQKTIKEYPRLPLEKFRTEVNRLKKLVNKEEINLTLSKFLDLAVKNLWSECDAMVLKVCDDPAYIYWATIDGFVDERLDARDLAISIFEQTKQAEWGEKQREGLKQILAGDENLHLRRKAAFALFKYGDHSREVIERIKDAVANDEGLKGTADKFLSQLK